MNAEMTQKLYEKYPAIFANRCGLELGDGWSGIIIAMCEAMTEAYTTCIYVDATRGKAWGIEPKENPDGEPRYAMHVECPQVIARQVKEKYATLRFHYRLEFEPRFRELAFGENSLPEATRIADRYHSFMDGIVHMAETLSARTCEETGKEGELHVSNAGISEWWRTLNREFARMDPQCRSRNYVPVDKEKP
jgi:hypothetical protein